MIQETESQAQGPPADTPAPKLALYVATNLDYWEEPIPLDFGADVTHDGRSYRRLDGPYYAWLQHKIANAGKAAAANLIPIDAHETLCRRFEKIHGWAAEHIGKEALAAACRDFTPKGYSPPPSPAFDSAEQRPHQDTENGIS